LHRDDAGWFYFDDRLGDTFRYKGENVATLEVERVLLACANIRQASVYGVTVQGVDGRAGMAAIVPSKEGFSAKALHDHVTERLPRHARPIFVRTMGRLEETATLKPQKRALVAGGFDPAGVSDPLYVRDDNAKSYVPLTPELYRRIQRGQVRLG
jgi:fatty-acyl-CoA synthase